MAGHEILKHVADTWANLLTIPFRGGKTPARSAVACFVFFGDMLTWQTWKTLDKMLFIDLQKVFCNGAGVPTEWYVSNSTARLQLLGWSLTVADLPIDRVWKGRSNLWSRPLSLSLCLSLSVSVREEDECAWGGGRENETQGGGWGRNKGESVCCLLVPDSVTSTPEGTKTARTHAKLVGKTVYAR